MKASGIDRDHFGLTLGHIGLALRLVDSYPEYVYMIEIFVPLERNAMQDIHTSP